MSSMTMATSSSSSTCNLPYAKNLQGGGVPRQTTTCLTFSRHWLQHIANETVLIGRIGHYTNEEGHFVDVSEDLQKAMSNSVHYHSSHVFHPPFPETPRYDTKYVVRFGSSLELATTLQNKYPDAHVGILNSSSSKSPGGKFRNGTISQEDTICRASLLYPCLAQFDGKPHYYYTVNRKPKYQGTSSSCCIFCPHVPVIRDDTVRGALFDEYYKFSFASIPAPNAFVLGTAEETKSVPKAQAPGTSSSENDYETMTLDEAIYDRCFRALCMMLEHGCTDLILCAFGCGVHGNNPEQVAATFYSLLEGEFKGCFRIVAFSIQPSRHANYKAFVETFSQASEEI